MYTELDHHPFATSNLTGQTALVLSPHQDDESLACGGSLALHAINGDKVKVVFLTDGARADTRAEYSTEDYVALRCAEASSALTILGITDMEFWNIPDRGLAQSDVALDRLCNLLCEYRPQLVYAPSPLEFHPDHLAAARLIWDALAKTRIQCRVAFYDYNRPINVNTLIDISAVVQTKRQACDCYQSQLKYYSYTECAISLNRYRSLTVSPSCQYAEGFFVIDSPEIWNQPIESFATRQFLPSRPQEIAPLVSVILRTCNRPSLLREAISSVVAQTYRNIELIVVNDGGDEVQPILSSFQASLPITYVRNEKSLGRAAAANVGVRAAQGKYISFLDDDDVIYAGHVEKLAGFLEKSGEHFAYTDCELCNYHWNGECLMPSGEKRPFHGIDFDRQKLEVGNYIANMCAMFRKDLFQLSGPFDESLQWLEDWDLWIRMAQLVNFHHLPGVSCEYRRLSEPEYGRSEWINKIYEKHGSNGKRKTLAKHLPQNVFLEKTYQLSEFPAVSKPFASLPILRGQLEEIAFVPPDRLHITGWLLSLEAPLRAIDVHHNGREVQRYPLHERQDVGEYAPWIQGASKSGFGFSLNVGDSINSGDAGLLEIVGLCENGTQIGLMSHLLRSDVDRFPTPPEELMFSVTHKQNSHFYSVNAMRAFGDIIGHLSRHVEWQKVQKMLDWGCGSGRLSAQFLSATPSIEVTGADIDLKAIEWCRSTFRDGRFHVVSPMPPTDYDDDEFDLVIAFSVFTHLRSEIQEVWLHEMHRVLKPGGWLVATTHGEFAYQFAQQSLAPTWPTNEFHDIEDSTLDGIAPSGYYRGTYQTENYTRREFSKVFQIVEYIPRGAVGFQDLVIMRK